VLRSNRYRTKVLASLDMTRRRAKKYRLGGGSILVAVLLVQRKWGGAMRGGKEGRKEGIRGEGYHNCVLAFSFRVDHRIVVCLYSTRFGTLLVG